MAKLALQAISWYTRRKNVRVAAMLVTSRDVIARMGVLTMEDIIPLWSKKCSLCGQVKPIEDFSPGTVKPYFVASHCKACKRTTYGHNHPKKVRVIADTKQCTHCKQVLKLEDFVKDSTKRDGHASICKTCKSEYIHAKYVPRPRRNVTPAIPEFKRCKVCEAIKPIDSFRKASESRDRHKSWCRECEAYYRSKHYKYEPGSSRKYGLKKYKLTPEQYDAMLEAQGGVCAVCGNPETTVDKRTNQARKLSVDHNHMTGQVRALLCRECNHAFGNMHEDPERIKALLTYAEKWEMQ